MRSGGGGGGVGLGAGGCGTMDVELSLQTSFPATTESQSKCTSIIVFSVTSDACSSFKDSAGKFLRLHRRNFAGVQSWHWDLSCVHGLSYTKQPKTPVGQNGLGLGLAAHFPIYVCTVALATRGFTLRPRDHMSI